MPPDGDPYLYPGTTTLKNKLGIRDPKALERAEDERAAARYAVLERNLPQPPFTFETLTDIQSPIVRLRIRVGRAAPHNRHPESRLG
jgi:fido (protein-threonine AMPylation protein)